MEDGLGEGAMIVLTLFAERIIPVSESKNNKLMKQEYSIYR